MPSETKTTNTEETLLNALISNKIKILDFITEYYRNKIICSHNNIYIYMINKWIHVDRNALIHYIFTPNILQQLSSVHAISDTVYQNVIVGQYISTLVDLKCLFDSEPRLLFFNNGVYDLESFSFKPC